MRQITSEKWELGYKREHNLGNMIKSDWWTGKRIKTLLAYLMLNGCHSHLECVRGGYSDNMIWQTVPKYNQVRIEWKCVSFYFNLSET